MAMKVSLEAKIWLLMLCVLVSGGLNRVFNKILVTPMSNDKHKISYTFFVSLFNGVAYVFVYFIILFVRVSLGYVRPHMIRHAWQIRRHHSIDELKITTVPPMLCFVIMGCLDGAGNILGLIAAPYISGPMISLMSQAIVIFSIASSMIFLRIRYTAWQTLAALTVLMGASLSLVPDIQSNNKGSIGYSLLTAFSTLPNAISFTFREVVFKQEAGLDVFIVNSHGSLWQLLLNPIFLPLTLLFDQTNGEALGPYIKNGMTCMFGTTPEHAKGILDCEGLAKPLWSSVPFTLPYLCYIICNLTFNISLLFLLKYASALQSFMTIKAVLPISVTLFYLHWPYLTAQAVNGYLLGGLFVILGGLCLFRYTTLKKEEHARLYGKDVVGCMSFFPIRPRREDHIPLLVNTLKSSED
eukprot:PhM_4_TR6889/c0_g1_i1/m.74489